MAGDVPLQLDDEWHTPSDAHESVLDRRLTLTLSAGRWIAVVVALVAAALLRLPGLDRWAFTASEAASAMTARDLILGNNLPNDLLGRPFTVEWVALFMFLGDHIDSVARISMALVGVGAVVLTLALGRWIGTVPATAAALLLAFSPTMVANSRRLDGGMLIVTLALLCLLCILNARDRTSAMWPVLAGISAAALLLTGPLGLAGLLLVAIMVAGVVDTSSRPPREQVIAGVIGLLFSYVLIATALFTHPRGLISATGAVFGHFFGDHIANAGEKFHVPLVNLIVNEPVLLALGMVGFIATSQRNMARSLGLWFVVSLVLVSAMGDTGIAGHALVVLPLALLSGLGVTHLFERLPWTLIRRGPAAVYIGLVLLLFFAVVSVIGLLTPAGGLSGSGWVFNLLLIVAIVLVPLAMGISLLARRLTGHQLVLILTAGLLVVAAIGVRSAVLAASERPGEPMDPLAQGGIAESLPAVVNRVQRVSIDLTRTERTAQDPTGGHGLHIAIDEEIEYPLRWYFRNFPNVTVFNPLEENVPDDAQVAFLAGDIDTTGLATGLVGEHYLYNFATPDVYSSPDWADLLRDLFQISEWRKFVGFLIERSDPDPTDRREFQLLVTPGIGERLFGPSGPFALDDLAGAGVEGGQFNSPRGVAVADDGSIYVVDTGNHRVQIFDADGEFVSSFGQSGSGPGQFAAFAGGQGGAGGIAITGDRVFVADTWNHRVQVFDLDGAFITAWGSFFDAQDNPEQAAANEGLFYGPRGIAVADDLVYVTDTGNERVQVFTLDGEFVRMFGSAGSGEGQLLEPVGITVRDGVVYVADSHNARIARFSLEGEPLDAWNVERWQGLRFFEPYLASSADGRMFASTSASGQILVLGENGEGGDALTTPDVSRPFGIALRPGGNELLVADGGRNAVLTVNVQPR